MSTTTSASGSSSSSTPSTLATCPKMSCWSWRLGVLSSSRSTAGTTSTSSPVLSSFYPTPGCWPSPKAALWWTLAMVSDVWTFKCYALQFWKGVYVVKIFCEHEETISFHKHLNSIQNIATRLFHRHILVIATLLLFSLCHFACYSNHCRIFVIIIIKLPS